MPKENTINVYINKCIKALERYGSKPGVILRGHLSSLFYRNNSDLNVTRKQGLVNFGVNLLTNLLESNEPPKNIENLPHYHTESYKIYLCLCRELENLDNSRGTCYRALHSGTPGGYGRNLGDNGMLQEIQDMCKKHKLERSLEYADLDPKRRNTMISDMLPIRDKPGSAFETHNNL